ncbi:hypothetical protein E4U50_003642 [Claviceps purpurea]|nr:hypothetical protein E4U50_003642 [Claviceps purpurea]
MVCEILGIECIHRGSYRQPRAQPARKSGAGQGVHFLGSTQTLRPLHSSAQESGGLSFDKTVEYLKRRDKPLRLRHSGANTRSIVAALTLSNHSILPELSLEQHLQLAPDLSAYFETEVGSEPLMMAQPVPHQTDKKRVKVYELRENDWFDLGTGLCTATFIATDEGRKDPRVLVESEAHPEQLLLETKIQKEDGFQKQQETLIVWQESSCGTDMALSFQEAEGCALIWDFVSSVQKALSSNLAGDDSLSDDLTMEAPPSMSLPMAELGNLPEIESNVRILSTGANGRDALTKYVIADDYIMKLVPLVEMAEDLESLPDLHRLCNIMKAIILLNDTAIIERAISDDCLLGVMGALEYDPDFPSHKANHRQWLENRGRFKEVVPIEDEHTLYKIHQTYRLQYLKDVVLARILDDPTFSVLNSLIFFNHVEVVSHIQSNERLLSELFSIFNANCRDEKKKKDAILFIQQCSALAKIIQAPTMKTGIFHHMLALGLLQVIHYGLRHRDVGVRVAATEILVTSMDHEPQQIRQAINRQLHDNQPTLVELLVDVLLVEVDLGVKTQVCDVLKVFVDQGIPPPGPSNGQNSAAPMRTHVDPQQELFLTRLYERAAPKLFKPLIDLERQTDLNFGVQQASMFSHLVDVLLFFIRQHHRYSRYFVLSHNLVQRVAQLLKSREKFLQLVAIRFFRSLIALQDEFYLKQILERRVLVPVLDILLDILPGDNLLSSACIELFEFVRKENHKDLIHTLVADRRDSLIRFSYISTIYDLIVRYDQTQDYTDSMDYSLEEGLAMARRLTPMHHQLPVDPTEEDYWNTSDPEDDDEETLEELANDDQFLSDNGPLTPTKPLVDYASDEDSDENAFFEDVPSTDASEAPVAPEPTTWGIVAPPLERLSEKRRREEDEDDELDRLLHTKRRSSSTSDIKTTAAGPRLSTPKRKSFGGGSGTGKISISLSTAAVGTGSRGRGRFDEES